MISLSPKPEPVDFDVLVRTPGNDFISKFPNPSTKQFDSHNYWKRTLRPLYESYEGICAYCREWIPWTTGDPVVDHYKSKKLYPTFAYEWSNYRLACLRFNGRKGDYDDVIDPFFIADGWFTLEMPSLLVKPNPNIDTLLVARVRANIDRLKLNDELCIEMRMRWINDFKEIGKIDWLQKRAPFIAYELKRQGLHTADDVSKVFKPHPKSAI